MAFSYGKEEVDYFVQKYGIGEVADNGKRVELQVRRFQRNAPPGISYDYVFKQSMIPGRRMALAWEKFYTYTFAVRHGGRKPPFNKLP